MNKVKVYEGVVREVDVSHMRAAIEFEYNGQTLPWDVKVGRIYDLGEKIKVYDVSDLPKPYYLQGVSFIDKNPVSEANVMKGN